MASNKDMTYWDFFQKLKPDHETGCLLWTGPVCNFGYGALCINYEQFKAHRWALGPTLGKHRTAHTCGNKLCCNPQHIVLQFPPKPPKVAKVKTLIQRKPATMSGHFNRQKTHCPYGHPYSVENTYVKLATNGTRQRQCRTCISIRTKKAKLLKKLNQLYSVVE
jgi:hypothetical protein